MLSFGKFPPQYVLSTYYILYLLPDLLAMKRLPLVALAIFCYVLGHAQLLTWTPPFPKEADPAQTLEITVDAAKGNRALLNYSPVGDVYVHIGVITTVSDSPVDWEHSKFTWGTAVDPARAVSLGANKWKFTISGSLRTYFNITDPNEKILSIAILFRNGTGSIVQRNSDGTDMYIPVYDNNLAVRIDQPFSQPKYNPTPDPQTWIVGSQFTITANASAPSTIKIYHNSTTALATASNVQTLSANSTVTSIGNQQIIVEASNGTTTVYDTLNIFVAPAGSPVQALPAGVQDGINYLPGDTAAILVLRAPNKNIVTVIGDFNNWTQGLNYIMNKTPDGKFFWLRIGSLVPQTEYGFQYVVDDTIKIADPYTQKVLDPGNDGFIPASTYPNLKPYPAGQTGIVSILHPGELGYNWAVSNFSRPDKRGLVIYELLIRDFVAAHDFSTIRDSLDYLKKLGINAIELMPVNEFEGNISWGYNSSFYFAPDKYYGTKNSFKVFIDSCHKKGIAVIMDLVLNHTYGPSPLARLYWDAQNNRPASNNPWYNPVQPHAFGFGDDFNHESNDTKYFFNRVLQHWLTEYKIDGYRLDFTKGLTQRASSNDAGFSAYDASRIAIINGYANTVRTVHPDNYIILEHFADNTEEKELSDNGMLLWANVWTQYQQASMGFQSNSNFDWGIHSVRGWNQAHLVTFMESHDEERIVYKNLRYGNSSGSYSVRDEPTALKRMELNAAFMLTIPGPKMIWQFGELGYDYSRCHLSTNGEGGDCNRKLDPKPIRWDYLADPRRKSIYDTYSQLNNLRSHSWYRQAFLSGTVDRSLATTGKWIRVSSGDTSHLVVVGNFDVVSQTIQVSLPVAGTWFDYLQNTSFTATGTVQNITMQPGEFHVYLNRNVNNITVTPVTSLPGNALALEAKTYPNPSQSSLMVDISMPQSQQVRIEVFATTGQYISTLYNRFLPRGNHTLNLNRPALARGSYFMKITTKNATKTLPVTFQ
jgi:1,4-alpha-glucan branching enzyme